MASSCESGVATMTVCQTCGDKGDTHLLIDCVKCHDSAVHHYCLGKSPNDDKITWMCAECAPKVAKVGPSRKSERICSIKDQAVNVRINWKKRLNKNSCSTAKTTYMKDRMAEMDQLTDDCSLPGEKMKNRPSSDETRGNQGHRKQRSLMPEDGGHSQEQVDSVKAKASPSAFHGQLIGDRSLPGEEKTRQHSSDETHGNQGHRKRSRLMPEDGGHSQEQVDSIEAKVSQTAPHVPLNRWYNQPSLESDNCVSAQPVIDPIWRGRFSITDEKGETFIGILAHLSNKACPKVLDAATAMPHVVDIKILPTCDTWPNSFQKSPPTDDNIALYFFPEYDRDEKVFDGLLDHIIEHNRALKAMVDDVELLIFSSRELPQQHWRFRRKYYLWGVFRQEQHSLPVVPTDHPVFGSSSADCVMLSKHTNQARSQEVECFAKNITESPTSASSTGSTHVSGPPHSPFLSKDKSSSPDSLSSHSSSHPNFLGMTR